MKKERDRRRRHPRTGKNLGKLLPPPEMVVSLIANSIRHNHSDDTVKKWELEYRTQKSRKKIKKNKS